MQRALSEEFHDGMSEACLRDKPVLQNQIQLRRADTVGVRCRALTAPLKHNATLLFFEGKLIVMRESHADRHGAGSALELVRDFRGRQIGTEEARV
jgi:hypothetical protein